MNINIDLLTKLHKLGYMKSDINDSSLMFINGVIKTEIDEKLLSYFNELKEQIENELKYE